jgi:hypothetical protein
MKRTLHLLRAGPTLIVSLPDNSPDLARAADAGGAQVLKVHINVHHNASGTHFGSLDEERPRLEAIRHAVNLAIGIVPGVTAALRRDEMETLADMGFDFIDTFAHCFPSWLLELEGMTKVMAVDSTYTVKAAASLARVGMEILEAAVIPHAEYGEPLTCADLALYARLAEAVPTPIIVPSQRRLEPHDVARLAASGINGVMIGAIVTGLEPTTLEAAARAFRAAVDELAHT